MKEKKMIKIKDMRREFEKSRSDFESACDPSEKGVRNISFCLKRNMNRRDKPVKETYTYHENQPKNQKEIVLSVEGYNIDEGKGNYSTDYAPLSKNQAYFADYQPKCPQPKKKKDVWVGIL